MKYTQLGSQQNLITSHRSILIAPTDADMPLYSGRIDDVPIGSTRKKCHTLLKKLKEGLGEPYTVPSYKDEVDKPFQVMQPPQPRQEPLKPSTCAICGQANCRQRGRVLWKVCRSPWHTSRLG